MTKHGRDPSHSSFSRHRGDRIPLLVGGPCRCVGVHRYDDAVRNSADRHSSDCACAEHFGRFDWRISILARRSFFVATVLAICAAFHPGCVRRRLFAAVCFGSENSNWHCAAFLRRATSVSTERSSANLSPITAGGDKRRGRPRISGRAYWDRWRNISHTAAAVLSMGAHSPGRCRVGTLHLGKFNSRTSWLFHESSFHPFARADSCSGCNHWRRHRLASGEQTFRCSSDFGISGDSASYRRNKTSFDEVGRLTSIANV